MANDSIINIKGKNLALYRTYTENGDLSATEYLAPTKIKIGVDNDTPNIADTDLDWPVPIEDGIVNDDGDNQMTGSDGGDNSTDNTTTYKQGANITDNTAQNLIKNDTNATAIWTISDLSTNGTNITDSKYGGFFLYIKDVAALAKFVSAGTSIELKLGSAVGNYYSITRTASQLSTGWNWISSNSIISEWDETGAVAGDIDTFIIEITTNNATDEFVAGDVIYDLLRTWDYADTITSFTANYPQFDYTNNEVAIRSSLNTIQGNGFLINGLATVNEDTTPLMLGEDTFDGESKSPTDEFIFVIKDRIL